MDQTDLLFTLKNLFTDANGKLVISRLIKFPLIMEFIANEENLKKIVESLGDNSQSWTLTNICKVSNAWLGDGNFNNTFQFDTVNHQIDQIELSVKELSGNNKLLFLNSAIEKIKKIKETCSWEEIFTEIGLEDYSGNDENKTLETIISAISENDGKRRDFVRSLLSYSKNQSGPKLLAHLTRLNKTLAEFTLGQPEESFSEILIPNFIYFIQEMQSLGELEEAQKIAGAFLEKRPFSFENYSKENHDKLNLLQYLKNYASLFSITGSQSELKRLSAIANEVLDNIEQNFIKYVKTSDQGQLNSSDLEFIFDESNDDSDLVNSTKKLMQISGSDKKSATLIAEKLFTEISNGRKPINSLLNKEFGFLITPLAFIEVFIDLNLIEKAYSLLRLALTAWPGVSDLLRLGANFSNTHGNHQSAINYFSELEVSKDLTREEKIKFAQSLEYLGRWDDAFLVRKKISISNVNDQIDQLICAFHDNKIEKINQLIDQNVENNSPLLCQILRSFSKNSNPDFQTMEEGIISAINFGEVDKKGVFIGADYFQRLGEIDRAINILESYQKNSENDLELINILHILYKMSGNKEKCQWIYKAEIKNILADQKNFEDYVEILISSENIEKAERTLDFASDKWRLSPRKIDLNLKILIEKNQFRMAKRLINDALSDYAADPNIVFDYCLASLSCRISDFPLGIEEKDPAKLDSVSKLFLSVNRKDSLLHDLLFAELNSENRLDAYKSLLKKYSNTTHQDLWRILAGMGNAYFAQRQFDSAIVNFKTAHEIEPGNEKIGNLLIRSYMELGLWDEIEKFMASDLNPGKQGFLKLSDIKGSSINSKDLIRFLERQVQHYPQDIERRIVLSQILSKAGRKEESSPLIKNIFSTIGFDNANYLLCLQVLIDADELILAERSAEIFLANKKNPAASDFLSIAFVFDQLGKYNKSLAILKQLNLLDSSLLIYQSNLHIRINELEAAESLIRKAYKIIDGPDLDLSDIQIRVPEIIIETRINPERLYSRLSHLEIKNKDINAAVSILEDGLNSNSESETILSELLSLLSISGKIEKIDACINGYRNIIERPTSPLLSCQLGENSLSQNEEIKAANYLSLALELNPVHPRVIALQSRLVAKNGNLDEARKLINALDIDTIIGTSGAISKFESNNQAVDSSSRLWLVNALNDLEDYSQALRICMLEIETFGIFTSLVDCFLTALDPLLEKEIINKEARVNCQNSLITEKNLSVFEDIKNYVNSDSTVSEKILNKLLKCQIFLNDADSFKQIEKIDPGCKDLNAILYGTYRAKGKDSAEILFNSYITEASHNLFMAALEKDVDPETALAHIKNVILQKTTSDSVTYALLALIERNLGNFSDALAAISLALEKEPDELNWLIMAGELSEKTGDMRSALSFYERANEKISLDNLNINTDSLIMNIGDERAITILEKQLSEKINREKLLELGNLLMKYGEYRKAIKIFNQFAKEFPDEAIPYLRLAEITLILNNSKKAQEFADKGLELDGSEVNLICFKGRLLKEMAGFEAAIIFVEQKIDEIQSEKVKLIFLKAELLAEYRGDQTALEFLNSLEDMNDNRFVLLEKARIELRLGNLDVAEKIAEELINDNYLASDSLAVLGNISVNRGELDRAIDFYIKAIDLNPLKVENFSNLAETYKSMNENKKAIETLEEGLKINVGDFKLLYQSGLFLYQHGLYLQAEKRIKEAIKINPAHKDARNIYALLENSRMVAGDNLVLEIEAN